MKPPDVPGFPAKPVQIIIPFGPGGGYDGVARQLAVPMQRILGQPVVVQNVPGGESRIGARQFQQQAPDGHTLGFFSDSGLFVDSLLNPPEGFDLALWIWVAGVRKQPAALFVGKDSPYKTVQDLVDADAKGTRLRTGHNGIGGGYLISQVLTAKGLDLKNVGYVGGYTGTADIIPALVRGDTDFEALAPISSMLQFIRSGDIVGLACLQEERSDLLPGVRTIHEIGTGNPETLETVGARSNGIVTVPGTPADRVAVLEYAVLEAIRDQAFQKWAESSGVAPDLLSMTGKEFGARKQREYDVYRKYVDDFKAAQGT